MAKTLYIIDGYSQIFRAYYSPAARRRTLRGKPIGAVYIFTRMLQKVMKLEPDMLICAMDPKGPTFRNEIFSEYKANREATPEDLKEQIPVIEQILEAFQVPIGIKDGFEADDVIGTLARQGEEHGYDVRLISKDKDLKQLLTDRVKMLNTDDSSEFGPEELKADLGITPRQMIDLLALAGDTADNIPGAKGIGPKTAATLLQEYGDLPTILEHAEEIKQPKRRENLIAFREHAPLSLKLVTINTEVPGVDVDHDASTLSQPDKEKLFPLLMELNFKSVIKELGWVDEAASVPQTKGKNSKAKTSLFDDVPTPEKIEAPKELVNAGDDYTLIEDEKGLKALVKAIIKAKRICLHVAGDDDAPPVGIAFCQSPGSASYLGFSDDTVSMDDALAILKPILEDPNIAKIGHDLKRCIRLLHDQGVEMVGVESDTRVDAFVLDGSREDARLASLSREFLGIDTVDWDSLFGVKKERKPLDAYPVKTVMKYAAQFADFALRVSEILTDRLKEQGLDILATDMERPLIEVLARMENHGIRIDRPYLQQLDSELEDEIAKLAEACHKLAGREFSIGSPKQLGEVLFDELELPVQGKTAKGTGRSTDAATLEKLTRYHDLPAKVLEWRHLSKLKSTYVDQLIVLADDNDRVHTTYRQTVATGRLSSKDPNLQNIPVRTEAGRKIRKAFIARDGWKLLAADYSQIELRVLAHISQEKRLIDAFKRGVDIHTIVAAGIFEMDENDVGKDERNVAKTVNYGVLYGQSAHGLSQGLGISRADAKRFIDNYFKEHPRVKALTTEVLENCRKNGYVETLAGRKRYLHDIGSRNAMVRKQAERQAFNTVLQGTAADLIKQAMLDADREIRAKGHPFRMLLQVHDELIFECPKDDVEACATFMKQTMESAMTLDVPLTVDVGVGDNWLEAK